MIAFGPIPSRRLGHSLGINHLPQKACSFNCAYCQAGATLEKTAERRAFLEPAEVVREVGARVAALRAAGEPIDFLSFVPDGEPTLDASLGEEIAGLKPLGIPIAVITNGSLLWRPEVRAEVGLADWVSVKVDAVAPRPWMRLDRPAARLDLARTLEGIRAFAAEYRGTLVTETMLAAGYNDDEASVRGVAEFLSGLGAARAYLLVPTRPPAESAVQPPEEAELRRACEIFHAFLPDVECLAGHETSVYGSAGPLREELLSTVLVHPMREAAVRELVRRKGGEWGEVEALLSAGALLRTEYRGESFLTRGAAT